MTSEPLKVLSLGAGVQSSTVLLMSCIGALPKLDAAIFADTGWEPKAVYTHLGWLVGYAQRHDIPVFVGGKGNIRSDALRSMMRKDDYEKLDEGRWAAMPWFTKDPLTGQVGQIKRQCTKEYKIEVIEKIEREQLLGLVKGQRAPRGHALIEQWFGISRDEMRRVRQSSKAWVTFRYPLIYDIPCSRAECLLWLEAHDFPTPPRSACIGCPFRSNAEWRQIQQDPEEWADAVEFDKQIRHRGGMRGETFLHRSCVPLDEVDLSTAEERGQRNWLDECTGMCGV